MVTIIFCSPFPPWGVHQGHKLITPCWNFNSSSHCSNGWISYIPPPSSISFELSRCKPNFFSIIFQLKNTMVGKTTSIDDPLLQRLWTHSSNPAKAFLLSVGFDQVMEGNQKVLCLKWDFEQISLEDVYVAVFVMCTKI